MHEKQETDLVLNVGELQSYKLQDVDDNKYYPPHWISPTSKTIEQSEFTNEKGVPPEGWRSCFQHFGGTIYLAGGNKTVDAGRTMVAHDDEIVNSLPIIAVKRSRGPESAVLSRSGFFLSLAGRMELTSSGIYHVKTWRSTDNLKTIEEVNAEVRIPLGPRRHREPGEWFGLYISRNIVEMPDGSLLATAQGTFDEDNIEPSSGPGKDETHYLGRTFVISSKDQGRIWDYLSTVAAPQLEDPVDEGFGEPTMVRLDNRQLLCIMRTGHHRPLYACWSSDDGKTWTDPVYTGLERGAWPCLIKLTDGRLALAYGNRFPPGWSRITPDGDHGRWVWPGPGLVKLAINSDGTGKDWDVTTIGSGLGSVYPTMFETEPNVLFCQVDGWYWRVTLEPKGRGN